MLNTHFETILNDYYLLPLIYSNCYIPQPEKWPSEMGTQAGHLSRPLYGDTMVI